jgi:hypothetical protein
MADSCSINAASFSSATQRNGFRRHDARPQSRFFWPLESMAETQPQLQPASLRLSAMMSHQGPTVDTSVLGREQENEVYDVMHRDCDPKVSFIDVDSGKHCPRQ